MLEFFRQHVAGLFGIVIVGVLALAFVFSFGAQSAGWGKSQSERYAATVDGVDIPEGTFQYASRLSGGDNSDRTDAQVSALNLSVLSGLIERQLLLNLAEYMGITASIEEAENEIIKNKIYVTRDLKDLTKQIESSFFIDPSLIAKILVNDGHRVRQSFTDSSGNFELETYQKFVRYFLQMTEEEFVEQQRLEIIAKRIRQLMVSAVRVSQDEIRAAYERENNTATIEYIRLIPSYFSERLSPDTRELDEWAKNHPDEVKQYYETNKFRYTNVEKMARARHILIKVDEEATDDQKAKARKEIDALLARARGGENFSELAKAHSQDSASAVKGGDMGFTPRGRMVPEFDDAMFALAPSKISDVVTTKYGYHIIKVEAFREGNITLEAATPEIAESLYGRSKGEELSKSTAEEFLARLKAGETMAALVPEEQENQSHLSLKVLTTRPFSKTAVSIPGIGEAKEMVAAVFDLTNDNPIPDKVFKIRNDYYVIRLAERNQPNDEEYEKLKDAVANKLLSLKQGAWLRDQVTALRRDAESRGAIAIYYTAGTSQASPMTPPTPETGIPEKTADETTDKAPSKSSQSTPIPSTTTGTPTTQDPNKPADRAPEDEVSEDEAPEDEGE